VITEHSKLYVQLRPDTASIEQLLSLQGQLPPTAARLVSEPSLHMTIIHIGIVERLITSLQNEIPLDIATILATVEKLSKQLEQLTAQFSEHTFTLDSAGFELFGMNHATLVLTFTPSNELIALHKSSLDILKNFLLACGIKNPEVFMQSDYNLQNALTLRPHVTLAKTFEGTLPSMASLQARFNLMPVVY
jgi:2'-5' RNA ligase